jgi:hypothetical protein
MSYQKDTVGLGVVGAGCMGQLARISRYRELWHCEFVALGRGWHEAYARAGSI